MPDSVLWRKKQIKAGKAKAGFGRWSRLRDRAFGTSRGPYTDEILNKIDEHHVQTVLAYWGTQPLPDIKALKRARPDVRFSLNLLCHPVGLQARKVSFDNFTLSQGAKHLDSIISSGPAMTAYLQSHIKGLRDVPLFEFPPCWTEDFGPKEPLPVTRETPNVVFLGRMDWQAGQSSDNVTPMLRELMDEGIDVHYARAPESTIEHAHAFPFDLVPLTEIADFASPFDVSLIAYNVDTAKVQDRFHVTVPDRLITSVAIGLPVALPKRGFTGCREYLKDYEAVIEYESMVDLAHQLRDRERMTTLRGLARLKSQLYRAEDKLPRLLEFLAHS